MLLWPINCLLLILRRSTNSVRPSQRSCTRATRIPLLFLAHIPSRPRKVVAGSYNSFRPRAVEGEVLLAGQAQPLAARKMRNEGFFEVTLPSVSEFPPSPSSYRIRFRTQYGETFESHDAYAFPFQLTEFDLYLMGEGRHYDTYEKLGAHLKSVDGVAGVHFAVWAPSARRVSVVGDFNRWDGRVHPMRARGSSGIWGTFYSRSR